MGVNSPIGPMGPGGPAGPTMPPAASVKVLERSGSPAGQVRVGRWAMTPQRWEGSAALLGFSPHPPQNSQPHPYLGQSTRVRLAPQEQEARGDRGGQATPFLQGDPWLHRGQGDRGDLGDLQGERCG